MVQSPYGYNPYMPFGTPGNIQSGTNDIQGVRIVAGIEEVKAASVPYGRSMFMNANEQIFYVKDTNGKIMTFKFEEVPEPTPENFVTKQELEKQLNDMRSYYESIISQQQPTASQPVAQQYESIPNHGSNEELPGNTGASQGGVLQADQGNGAVGTASSGYSI